MSTEPPALAAIAAKLALEVRSYGCCRCQLHKPINDKTPPCRHCEALAEYEAFCAIVQTVEIAKAQAHQTEGDKE